MELNEIEIKIAQGEISAAQVFTQMKQHIDVAHKQGWGGAIDAVVTLMESMPVDAETIKRELG